MGSIIFFLAAAIASVLVAAADPKKRQQRRQEQAGGSQSPHGERTWAAAELLDQRGRLLVLSMSIFGVIVLLIPCLCLFQERQSRDRAFYTMTGFFGAAFGVSFSLFQDLTWQILPPEVNFANAMGFNVMSRLLGVGLGNFFCGIILDMSYKGGQVATVYEPVGYVIMCCFSG